MNANPFTNGHRYLVEQAAKENDLVYVFVVNTDLSLFKTSERFELVKAGTADLKTLLSLTVAIIWSAMPLSQPTFGISRPDDSLPDNFRCPRLSRYDRTGTQYKDALCWQRTVITDDWNL